MGLGIQELLISGFILIVWGAFFAAIGVSMWKLFQIHSAVNRIEQHLRGQPLPRDSAEP